MGHRNPCGHTDEFRSKSRQEASDQLLPYLIRVARGDDLQQRVVVTMHLTPATEKRAKELAYSAAWFHDIAGRWRPGSYEDPSRLVHRVSIEVTEVSREQFEVVLRHRHTSVSGSATTDQDAVTSTAPPLPPKKTGSQPHAQQDLTEAIGGLIRMWDRVVDDWLEGAPAYNEELEPWLNAYTGSGAGRVIPEALPEPWFGDLAATPKAVFLALNPGQPFLGRGERWRSSGRIMPDLQSRNGTFAQEIRKAGSYSAWATSFVDWRRWAPNGNRFFTQRERFIRAWLDDQSISLNDCVNFELYPWHSKSYGVFRPGNDAKRLIQRYLLGPLRGLACPLVFAFGRPWFDALDSLEFRQTILLSTRRGDRWPHQPKDRVVALFSRDDLRIVAECHRGSAAPPKSVEVSALRDRITPHLDIPSLQ